MSRLLSVLQTIVSKPHTMHLSTSWSGAEARIPEENEFDEKRLAIDVKLFPYYHEVIRFAALTLDRRGLTNYGAYSIFSERC